VPQLRNPLGYLIIGAAIGLVLGAVIGIAIGEGAGGSSGKPLLARTVVSTQTVRVLNPAPAVSPPTTETPPARHRTNTTATTTDTTTTSTASAPPTTPTLIQPPTTDTTTTPLGPNDVPPADPFTPAPDFCNTHVCGAGYLNGTGYVVQCADGVWVKQGGQTTACRHDGGLT
jgi:hypothetical protein